MARIVAPGRRVAQRDGYPSGKRRNASAAFETAAQIVCRPADSDAGAALGRATEGRVLFVAGRVAGRLKWVALRRGPLLTGGKNHPGQIAPYCLNVL